MRQGVLDALDIANLVQQLQEERAAVALNNFLLDVDDADKQTNLDTIKEITGTELFLTLPGSRELKKVCTSKAQNACIELNTCTPELQTRRHLTSKLTISRKHSTCQPDSWPQTQHCLE